MAGYGVDVLDPAVTPRRIAVLLRALPPHARRGGEAWSTEAELLALLIDHVANLTWLTARAHGAKNAPRPRPLPRPSPARAVPSDRNTPLTPHGTGGKAGSWAEAAAILGGIPGVVTSNG